MGRERRVLLAGFCGLRLINITQEEKKRTLINVSVRAEMSKYVFDIIRSGSAASRKLSYFHVAIF